jgi:hypothetical protein
MYKKSLQVRFDKKTFPKGIPSYLNSGTVQVNMLQALLMLGSVTVPNGLSVASPATFWAWIRYFSAISPQSVLRITNPFVDLDPHLKTVLSDDFGVAVTTQWLSDSVSGFKQVVDGRRFILNYAHLLTHTPPPTKKIGPRKSPDFVVMDAAGKWHVIECKGTQTSPAHSVRQLKRAREQKGAIEISPKLKGLSLAAGLYLASEKSGAVSRIMVHDPETPEPLIRIDNADVALRAARRVTTARYFGLAGLPQLAYEAAFAQTDDTRLQSLFNVDELARSALPQSERLNTVYDELRASRQTFVADGHEYSGRQVSVEIPWPSNGYEPRRITVRQGIRAQYLESMRDESQARVLHSVEATSMDAIGDEPLSVSENETGASIRQGKLFISTISFD